MNAISWLLCVILFSSLPALAQTERTPPWEGRKFPVVGTFRPAPQLSPTRLVALVPVVSVPGTAGATAPLFLENLESPLESARAARTKLDSSKAEVPAGIVSYRAMYSDDGQWALVDLRARDFRGLAEARESADPRVRIFTAEELTQPETMKRISLPKGLNLAVFLED